MPGLLQIFGDKEMDKLRSASYRRELDSREQALYTISEAALYIGIQAKTLSTWVNGRHYPTKSGRRFWKPVIQPADRELGLLSFFNLAEAHILASTRYVHNVPFPAVRGAIDNVMAELPKNYQHPLLSRDFYTNGRALFVKTIEETIDISNQQLSFKQIMDLYLERIVRAEDDTPFKVFPIVPGATDHVVSIVSGVSSSRPIIEGTGVQVSIVWGRFNAGEEISSIANDFEIPAEKIKRAIDYFEWQNKKAA